MNKLFNRKTHIRNMQVLTTEEYDEIKKRLRVAGYVLDDVAQQAGTNTGYATVAIQNKRHGNVADRVKIELLKIIGNNWNPYILPKTERNIKKQINIMDEELSDGR